MSVKKDGDHPCVILGPDEYVTSSRFWIISWLIHFIQCLLDDVDWMIITLSVYFLHPKFTQIL